MERGDAVQPAACPARSAGEGRGARRRRVPVRVRHDRGLRRYRDGPRGDARIPREPRDHRGLGRSHDARGALRCFRRPRRMRQVASRDAHGRRSARPPDGLRLRRHDPAGTPRRSCSGRRLGVRGGWSMRCGNDRHRGAGGDRTQCVPDRGLLRRHVHGQHHGIGGRSARHGASGRGCGPGGRPPAGRSRLREWPSSDRFARKGHPASSDHDQGGLRERDRHCDGTRRLDQRRASSARDRERSSRRVASRRLLPDRPESPAPRGHEAARAVPHDRS